MPLYAVIMSAIFIVGLLAVIFEHRIGISKAAIALVMATLCWTIFFVHSTCSVEAGLGSLSHHLAEVSEVVFFLIGAMTIVELIDSHRGFSVITDYLGGASGGKMLWLMGLTTFFMSSLLDNLTATIVMLSLARKLIHNSDERKYFGAMIVIAANAGGAWTPIGDVTTTMLWIHGFVSSWATVKSLLVPSLVGCIVSIAAIQYKLKRNGMAMVVSVQKSKPEPLAKLTLILGVGSLIFVPIFKMLTDIPPFMGMLVAMGILWFVTDFVHNKHANRYHLRVPHALKKIDISGVLFFLGILLAVSALQSAEVLGYLARLMSQSWGSTKVIAFNIGLASAFVDNVPLVAAVMGMYDISVFPMDCAFWQMIAYCAGVGGSILVVGSAAGIAFMGMEKVDSLWYLRHVAIIALIGYFSGFTTYLLLS